MSGGFFDYQDYRLDDMAEQLEAEAEKGYAKRNKELFLETAKQLRNIRSTLHHIDYYLEGDHSEEDMHREIEEDKCI